jgi:hypothetical protein
VLLIAILYCFDNFNPAARKARFAYDHRNSLKQGMNETQAIRILNQPDTSYFDTDSLKVLEYYSYGPAPSNVAVAVYLKNNRVIKVEPSN